MQLTNQVRSKRSPALISTTEKAVNDTYESCLRTVMYTVSRLEVTTKIVGQQMVVKLMQHNLLEQFGEIAGLIQSCSFRNCLRQGHFFPRRWGGGGGGGGRG